MLPGNGLTAGWNGSTLVGDSCKFAVVTLTGDVPDEILKQIVEDEDEF